jgi:hypothetical protein
MSLSQPFVSHDFFFQSHGRGPSPAGDATIDRVLRAGRAVSACMLQCYEIKICNSQLTKGSMEARPPRTGGRGKASEQAARPSKATYEAETDR